MAKPQKRTLAQILRGETKVVNPNTLKTKPGMGPRKNPPTRPWTPPKKEPKIYGKGWGP